MLLWYHIYLSFKKILQNNVENQNNRMVSTFLAKIAANYFAPAYN